jgi:hypothetical protein
MSKDSLKQSDQINMLKAVAQKTDTGVSKLFFAYPNCGWHLVQSGLVTQDGEITAAGRAALFLLGLGSDPTDGGSFVEFEIDLRDKSSNLPPATNMLGEVGGRFVTDAIRAAYDQGYNDARTPLNLPSDAVSGYRSQEKTEEIAVDFLSRLKSFSSSQSHVISDRTLRRAACSIWQTWQDHKRQDASWEDAEKAALQPREFPELSEAHALALEEARSVLMSILSGTQNQISGYEEAIDAAKMARGRLMNYANAVQRRDVEGGGREFERRIWGSFCDFDQACDAIDSPPQRANVLAFDAADIELLEFAVSRLPEEWQVEGKALLEKGKILSPTNKATGP